jgi:hypothetical protein
VPGSEGNWGKEREGRGQQGEMAQTIYAHMSKRTKSKK